MPNLAPISQDLFSCVQRAVIVLSEKSIPHDRCYINLADRPD
jgi:glutathione S-transferase